jgi:NADH-quinone oxidoreductase subunit C
VLYILFSSKDVTRLIVKIQSDDGQSIPSVSDIWNSADWGEREVFDLMGVTFSNHPDLRRILTWENFEGHPLRKDFPLEGKDFGCSMPISLANDRTGKQFAEGIEYWA